MNVRWKKVVLRQHGATKPYHILVKVSLNLSHRTKLTTTCAEESAVTLRSSLKAPLLDYYLATLVETFVLSKSKARTLAYLGPDKEQMRE